MASPAAQPSAAPELDDDLRELSSQDAEELRAFQEKRRWFEGKLQLLEAVAPINPFVHPNLSQASLHHGGGGAVYEAAVSTASGERKHDLPKRELLDQWQSERDALEQEVLDFDDGDLGRMKEKTRAVTQVPLTPPSTHLVEITLDLILLIDRLLSLLRARFELLDLTSLRLTWDDLRWTVMLESSKITADLHQAIKGHATWLQSYTVSGSTDTGGTAAEPRATLPSININAFASPPVTSPYTSPTTSPRIGTMSSTPTSPSVSRHYRRPSTQLSSLRTALTTLRIRHSTLQSTAVSRAGAIMDQMIDRAGSLKSLAGACGLDMGAGEKKQNETSGDSGADQAGNGGDGAVPDAFLDIQDDLEGGVKALQEELSQGKALQKWFESAERTYTVHHEVQSTSASVIDTLRTAISKPASSSVHDDLHEQLCRAEKTLAHADDIDVLPKELRDSFSYIAQQIKGITAGMASTRLSSNKEISAARACLEWYREMTAASSKLDDHRRILLESTSEIFTLAAGLRDEQQQHRRSLDMDFTPASGEAHSPIDIGEAYRKLEAATAALSDTRKVIAQYQDCITARPTIVIHRLPKPAIGSAVKETEQAAAAMSKAIGEARSAVKAAEAHSNQQDSLLSIRDDLQHYNRTKDDIISDLVTALKSSQWDSTTGIADHSHDAPQALLESAESLLQRCNVATTAWSSLPLDSRNDPAQIPPEWHDSIREIGASVPRVKLLRDLLARSLTQAEAVRAVNTEAEALVSDADDTSSSAECLDRAERWTDSLTSRVAFIDFTSLGEVSADWKSLAGELQASQIGLRSHLNEAALRMRQDPSEPMAAKAAAARAGEDASSVRQDTAIDGFEAAEKEARRSRRQLRGLRLSDIAFPPTTLIARDSQPIPTDESVTVILACINEVRMDSEDDNVFPLEFRSRDIYLKLCDDLGSAQAHIPRLKALAAFDDAVNSCDQAFIAHAEATDDAGQAAEDPNTEARIDDIRMAVREVVQASGAVESDSRVRAEVQRIKSTWYSLAATLGVPSQIDDDHQDGAMSDATSFTSPPTSPLSTSSRHNNRIDPFGGPLPAPAAESRAPTGLRRFPSSASLARFGSTGTRTTSNPFPDRLTQPTASSRNRTVSDVNHLTPTSGAGSASSSTSRARATPRGAATPTRTRVDSLASSVRRMSIASSGGRRASGGSAMGGATHRRVSRLSGLGSSQRKDGDKSVTPKQERRKGPYVPNKRSELDVAIGKIVNDLKVDVPITAAEGRHSSASNATRPVGTANGSHVADDWQDESGRYWIGYEGRAKLCFCRILKSRMVMVRVGGGWMELSRFLLEHFSQMSWAHPSDALAADEAHPGTPSAETEQDTETSQTTDTTGAINSATPADAVYRTTIDPASAASPSPTTPMRPKNLATLTSDQKSSATPGSAATKTPISAGPLTPVRTPGSALPGPTNHHSPGLVPLHFIKKASDSPPVRDKEKERFAGRRSILGKGTPGRVEEL